MDIIIAFMYAIISIIGFVLGFVLGYQLRIRSYFHRGLLNNIIILTLIIIIGFLYSILISLCYIMLMSKTRQVVCEYV